MASTSKKLTIPNIDGLNLSAILHEPEQATKAIVIVCHGFGSRKELKLLWHCAEDIAEHGVNALRFDFSGCGESEGEFGDSSYMRQTHDLHAILDYLEDQGYGPIGVVGHSMGGAVSLLTASVNDKIKVVVDIAGPAKPNKDMIEKFDITQHGESQHYHFNLGDKKYTLNEKFMNDLKRVNMDAAMQKITIPVLFIHGDADKVVGVEDSNYLHTLCASTIKEVKVISGAGHLFSKETREVAKLVCEWMSAHLK